MMVTFVSQCQKKALNRTRRVLDSFANRIGDNTWQTVITNEGLNTVKKLLRKTASKNTAVSCFWVRSRSRSELVWIVGNRDRFNNEGFVPVNWTQKDILNIFWENDWHYLPLIQAITAISGLFHDWGKASACFQDKLKPKSKHQFKGDPLRHEWVSVLLLSAFVNEQTDEQWLSRLSQSDFDEQSLVLKVKEPVKNPFKKLPPLASLICWIIVSHHKIPLPQGNEKSNIQGKDAPPLFHHLLYVINSQFGYENLKQEGQKERLEDCLSFPQGLPCQSIQWLKQSKKWAVKLQAQMDQLPSLIDNGSWRLVMYYARLVLMLGDHHYSSQEKPDNWDSNYLPIANTYYRDVIINQQTFKQGAAKQKLDQHLIGVTQSALSIAHLLPVFENQLPPAFDINALKKKTADKKYQWQDKAVSKIRQWRNKTETDAQHFGFFTVNMASTGCGKTFANAKVMRELSPNGDSLRYILALGLRTLTLQTGDEYRERIGLKNDELAVMIGSRAVMELHQPLKIRETER